MTTPLTIYLAGPDVFLPDAYHVGRRKQEMCRQYGFDGLFPLDDDKDVGADAAQIFRANCRLMTRAAVGVFNLTPFRGASVDAGTAFEAGFMFAHGKRLFGYTSAEADYVARVSEAFGPLVGHATDLRDRDGYTVENFGLCDNLMIARAIIDSGGTIAAVADKAVDPGRSLAALDAFWTCLDAIRSRMSSGGGGAEVKR